MTGVVGLSALWLAVTFHPPFRALFLTLLLFLTVFRLMNLARVIKGRMHERYLLLVTRRTSLFIALYHFIALGATLIVAHLPSNIIIETFTLTVLFISLSVFLVTTNNIKKLRFKMPDHFIPDRELPTVTVAIPARNETSDLEECLRTVLANDYPKLEVIVLDDCSQDRTAEIIKSFAHEGVRFVKGLEPDIRWLAKNQAYEKLLEESNGDLILFCGVDVRLGLSSIRSMVNLLKAKNKQMLSVLPLRVAGAAGQTVIQPMRYWWELAIPRRLLNRPAVLSTCWIIDKKTIVNLGGFAAVKHAIIPEGFFARELVKSDSYSFVRSSDELDVRTVKNIFEQRQTALRVRYPQLRRRPETLLAITLVDLLIFVAPLVLLVYFGFTAQTFMLVIATITLICILFTHLLILQVSNPANVAVAVVTFPFSVIMELAIGYISMFSYEFGTIEWKDRNICIPVMHVYPHLPPLKD